MAATKKKNKYAGRRPQRPRRGERQLETKGRHRRSKGPTTSGRLWNRSICTWCNSYDRHPSNSTTIRHSPSSPRHSAKFEIVSQQYATEYRHYSTQRLNIPLIVLSLSKPRCVRTVLQRIWLVASLLPLHLLCLSYGVEGNLALVAETIQPGPHLTATCLELLDRRSLLQSQGNIVQTVE